MKAGWAALALGLALSAPSVAMAQQTDRVLAEALFREGRELIEQDKVSEACAKFAESYRLDQALGTLINLALCHEKEGKTATAWAEFSDAASAAAAEKDDRESFARRHMASLEAELPRLRMVVAPDTESLPSLEIKLDGHAIGKAAWSTLLPIDPGDHVLVAGAEGKNPFEAKVVIGKGAGVTNVNVPPLEDAPKAIVVPPPPREEPPPSRSPQRTIGYAVGGVGVVGLVVGAAFGVSALSLKGDRDQRCTGGFCDQEGLEADRSARTNATISTVSFIAGGALLLGGAALVLTAKKTETANKVSLGVGPRGVLLGGSF
ncbi:MAG: hypothetical protein KIT84_40535 [Labilithrix sp.]|nr:hypothetical protein [Labilithrix sp.]MCW5817356.1 hypothetical protein [Labilithrix sp.]